MRRAPCPTPSPTPCGGGLLLAARPPPGCSRCPRRPTASSSAAAACERRAFETPYAISVVDADELRSAGPMVNLSESLSRVPGLVANLRNNYAQDLQLSSRGFGARATFGIRGLRLYTDGIPGHHARRPGPGVAFRHRRRAAHRGAARPVLGAVRRQLRRRDLAGQRRAAPQCLRASMATSAATACGRHGWAPRRCCPAAGTSAPRPANSTPTASGHTARRSARWAMCAWAGSATRTRVTLLLNSVDQPAQDPLGLTRAQFDADPFQTTPQAILFDTRKTTGQTQGGASWRAPLRRRRRLARERAHALRRPARRDAVAGHPAGHAGQPAPSWRRDRLRPRLLRASTHGWPGAGTMPR